jgi:hypothetical protein
MTRKTIEKQNLKKRKRSTKNKEQENIRKKVIKGCNTKSEATT